MTRVRWFAVGVLVGAAVVLYADARDVLDHRQPRWLRWGTVVVG